MFFSFWQIPLLSAHLLITRSVTWWPFRRERYLTQMEEQRQLQLEAVTKMKTSGMAPSVRSMQVKPKRKEDAGCCCSASRYINITHHICCSRSFDILRQQRSREHTHTPRHPIRLYFAWIYIHFIFIICQLSLIHSLALGSNNLQKRFSLYSFWQLSAELCHLLLLEDESKKRTCSIVRGKRKWHQQQFISPVETTKTKQKQTPSPPKKLLNHVMVTLERGTTRAL